MNKPGEYSFRLSLRTAPKPLNVVFTAQRPTFKFGLSSAVIDLRLRDPQSPLVLDIGVIERSGVVRWIGFPGPVEGAYAALPSPIRWEGAGSIFDDMVKLYHAFIEEQDALPV